MSGSQRCGFGIGVGILWKPDLSIHVELDDVIGDEAQKRASSITSSLPFELTDEVQGCSGTGSNEVQDPLSRRHKAIMP